MSWSIGGVPTNAGAYVAADLKTAIITTAVKVTDAGGVYNGTPYSATGTAVGIGGTTPVSGTFSYQYYAYASGTWSATPPSAAGDYYVLANFTSSDPNYSNGSDSTNFTITKASSSITNIGNVTATYDGTAHGVAAPAVSGAGGLSTAATLAYYQGSTRLSGAPVDAGTYTVVASYVGDANHTAAADVSATIKINRADAVISVTGYGVTYDGNAHTATGSAAGVEAAPADLSGLLHLGGTAHTNATGGPVNDAWTFDGNGNYNATTGTVADRIDQAPSAVSVVGGTFTYDGTGHGATGSSVLGAGVITGTITLVYKDANGNPITGLPTNAGSYTVEASYAGDANHTASPVVGAPIVIKKATPTVQVTGGSYVYNGQPHPATGSVTGVNNANLGTPVFTYTYTNSAGTVVTTSSAPVLPGTYAVTASFAENGNYLAASATATITIAYNATILTDLSRPLNAGRTIPIKLQLADVAGNNVSSASVAVTAARLERVNADGSRTQVTLEDAGGANPGNLFRYDPSLGGYIFNLSTKGLGAGKYAFTWLAGADPTRHELTFTLV